MCPVRYARDVSIFFAFIDIWMKCVDSADMYRKRDFLSCRWRHVKKWRFLITSEPYRGHPRYGLHPSPASQHPAERLMQQRLLQLIERGELALVEGFEALGFFAEGV